MSKTHDEWMQKAIELSRQSPADQNGRYKVGAVIVDTKNEMIATGFTHETDNVAHAEEVALQKANNENIDLNGCTIYTTMEPCSERASRPLSCTELILSSGISKVVFGFKEPDIFVKCIGEKLLRDNGLDVVHLSSYEEEIRQINNHLIKDKT